MSPWFAPASLRARLRRARRRGTGSPRTASFRPCRRSFATAPRRLGIWRRRALLVGHLGRGHLEEVYEEIAAPAAIRVAPSADMHLDELLDELPEWTRVHASTVAVESFAQTLGLLHHEGVLVAQDLFVQETGQYASYRGPGQARRAPSSTGSTDPSSRRSASAPASASVSSRSPSAKAPTPWCSPRATATRPRGVSSA